MGAHQVVVLGAEAAAEDVVCVALQRAQALLPPHVPQPQCEVVRGCAQVLSLPVPAHIRETLKVLYAPRQYLVFVPDCVRAQDLSTCLSEMVEVICSAARRNCLDMADPSMGVYI